MTLRLRSLDKFSVEKEYDALKDLLKAEYPDRPDNEIEAEARDYLVKSVLRTHDRLCKV